MNSGHTAFEQKELIGEPDWLPGTKQDYLLKDFIRQINVNYWEFCMIISCLQLMPRENDSNHHSISACLLQSIDISFDFLQQIINTHN